MHWAGGLIVISSEESADLKLSKPELTQVIQITISRGRDKYRSIL